MSSITKKWTETDFRRELRKIDQYVKKTQGINLVGAELDIELSDSIKWALGVYYGKQKKFKFSMPFFNSDIPEESAIGVIKHEYAHYYAEVVYGYRGGHGAPFKAACQMVDTNPDRVYSKRNEYYARKREERNATVYTSRVWPGQTVNHPAYGEGTVVYVKCGKDSALLTVEFESAGTKIIDEVWLRNKGCIH